MKRKFSKTYGRVNEDIELALEEHMIFVHYKRGNIEKSACLLKNENRPLKEYVDSFLKENNVSEELKTEVIEYLQDAKNLSGKQWSEFTDFLMKALSLHMVFAVTLAVSIFIGYKSGAYLDGRIDVYPLFTLIGLAGGLALGGYSVYAMAIKYFKPGSFLEKKEKKKQVAVTEPERKWQEIDVSLDEVRKAVRKFSDDLPKGVYRTILVNDDNSIDFTQLAHILNGIPSRKFYMSKETYDLFEEAENHIPVQMDMVQNAVDQYVKDNQKYPMLPFDPSKRVNYYQLLQDHYLKEHPDIQFYITDCDGLVTHIRPSEKRA
ncbi:DUF3939 domain-containing protein [Neobacillus notoginsengisoli]|uniref:DUF3939 domain-containing protein n=1 Tax=Neobacillus notoginsengisoli TaxID=1578198 RepID=A0A417YL32_9BACI|nr:DUF3939 domain-containing protein [Neobacillus notoginsengisoli]RHW34160.1 DUF3939 domain-containing protein [Neobacillus notoginsengisoli]